MDFYTRAKQIVDYYRESLTPREVFGDDVPRNGGSAPAAQSEGDVLASYAKWLPTILGETGTAIPNLAGSELAATQGTQGAYDALNLNELNKYALPEAQIGQEVADSNAQAGAKTNLEQIQGAGGQAATAASDLNRKLNPEYYKSIGDASSRIGDALDSVSLNGLSPGEAAATERANNQNLSSTGNLGLNNGTNWISNAMNFGGAFNNKLGILSNLAGTAGNIAGVASGNGGFNPVSVATGQPMPTTMSNFGTNTFFPTTPNSQAGTTSGALGFGSSLLGGMNQANNVATQGAYSLAANNSPTSYLGAICCFIFLEAYNGKIPKAVRRGRDRYYKINHDIATGYRRTARYLVPLMQKYPFIRFLVWDFMVEPITKQLEHKGNTRYTKLITHFWLRLWAILGKGKSEQSYAMTWRYYGTR